MVKKFRRYVYSFWHDPRTWQTDRRTDRHHMTAIAALMHSIARQKSYIDRTQGCRIPVLKLIKRVWSTKAVVMVISDAAAATAAAAMTTMGWRLWSTPWTESQMSTFSSVDNARAIQNTADEMRRLQPYSLVKRRRLPSDWSYCQRCFLFRSNGCVGLVIEYRIRSWEV